MIRLTVAAAIAFVLAACGEAAPANPPTEPARPVGDVDPTAPAAAGQTSMLPGRGPTSFVGRWAADVTWCANPQGERRPIEITSTRFTGYENACEIAAVDEVADGYVATLACVSEGRARSERVRFQVSEDVMRLTYMDREGDPVTLRKCTTLGEVGTASPIAP